MAHPPLHIFSGSKTTLSEFHSGSPTIGQGCQGGWIFGWMPRSWGWSRPGWHHEVLLESEFLWLSFGVSQRFQCWMVTVRSVLGQGAVQCAVIEKDLRFLPSLRLLGFASESHHACNWLVHSREASGGRLVIHTGDVLSFNMCRFYYSGLFISTTFLDQAVPRCPEEGLGWGDSQCKSAWQSSFQRLNATHYQVCFPSGIYESWTYCRL